MTIRISLLSLFIATALTLASCKPTTTPGFTGNHLPPAVMQKLLLDINIAEAYSMVVKDSIHRAGIKNVDSLSAYYQQIFKHYNITEAQFNESFDWYKNHPEELDSIYTKNQQIISKIQSKPYIKPVKKDTTLPVNKATIPVRRLAPHKP